MRCECVWCMWMFVCLTCMWMCVWCMHVYPCICGEQQKMQCPILALCSFIPLRRVLTGAVSLFGLSGLASKLISPPLSVP